MSVTLGKYLPTSFNARFSSPPSSLYESEDDLTPLETPTRQPKRRVRRERSRYVLPMVIGSGEDKVEIMACPDSGSDENIMSLEWADRLGLHIQKPGHQTTRFSLANGKITEAIGQVTAQCSFGAGPPLNETMFACVFHVFKSLAVPVIIGMEFLEQTETLSKHRGRLVEQLVPSMQALRVNSVGRPRRNLICQLDSSVGCASADTGSDLDLVSLQFARSRAFKIESAYEQLEFADCSVGYTSGVINASFSVRKLSDVDGVLPRGDTLHLDFYVLEDLNADILVGQATIDDLDLFSLHRESFLPSGPKYGEPDVNIIRHIGALERLASKITNKLKDKASSGTSNSTESELAAELGLEDQRENARREAARSEIEGLTGPAKLKAQQYESSRIFDYEEIRKARLNSYFEPGTGSITSAASALENNSSKSTSIRNATPSQRGNFRCHFPGCTAQPFYTQYLLNSHAKVHSSVPLLYCPIEGCPRSQGGSGFHRSSELIRHGLVHDSPGYICPFCPDQEHKYPRPDNLLRHVRVFHGDKDKDDPLLREVLSQRVERRRRHGI
ncbi:hypothetical protein F5Y17DRAFT_464414 [Xylariaceae sp. FL0594]|nr:hypothetical protein F5Y17DRAFT_464414 [Xylariaceae sp. FL0594]